MSSAFNNETVMRLVHCTVYEGTRILFMYCVSGILLSKKSRGQIGVKG